MHAVNVRFIHSQAAARVALCPGAAAQDQWAVDNKMRVRVIIFRSGICTRERYVESGKPGEVRETARMLPAGVCLCVYATPLFTITQCGRTGERGKRKRIDGKAAACFYRIYMNNSVSFRTTNISTHCPPRFLTGARSVFKHLQWALHEEK